jgi:fructuronate reductase
MGKKRLSFAANWRFIQLNLKEIAKSDGCGAASLSYDRVAMRDRTRKAPVWLHFGSGNIFRAFPCALQDTLLSEGIVDYGIIAAETFDFEIIEKIYRPHDDLSLLVTLGSDGSVSRRVIGSVAKSITTQTDTERCRLAEIFRSPSLQMVSFTVTEKGYAYLASDGSPTPAAAADFVRKPEEAQTLPGIITSLLYNRYCASGAPISLVSMDNCSHNGDRLKSAVTAFATAWAEHGYVDDGFIRYISDPSRVGFPCTMIDKITPRPDPKVAALLAADGFDDTECIVTSKHTYIAPFVNAEAPQYLVVEDVFPAGRPPLERVGVIFTDRETVDKAERMKVCTCLNPLHTALAVFGCLLGYTLISEEMKNPVLSNMVRRLGYIEGLPVVTDPGIINPRAFIDEVVNVRLPNPFMPDSPQRIATDTSQKLSVRFGETIKQYIERGLNFDNLVVVPLVAAGWCRYLLGVDDNGNKFDISPDPLLPDLRSTLSEIKLGNVSYDTAKSSLHPIFSNESIFGVDLYSTPLGHRAEEYFVRMTAGKGAVTSLLTELFS